MCDALKGVTKEDNEIFISCEIIVVSSDLKVPVIAMYCSWWKTKGEKSSVLYLVMGINKET